MKNGLSHVWSEKDRFVFIVYTSHRHTPFFSILIGTGRQAAHFLTVQGIEIGRKVADVCTDDVSFFSYCLKGSRIFLFSEACQASGNATWMTNTDYSVRAFIHLQIYGIFYEWRDFHRKNLHFSFFKVIRRAFSRFGKREAGSKEREHWGITAQRKREQDCRRRRKQDCWRRKEQHCWRRRKQGCARSVVDRCRRRRNYRTKRKTPMPKTWRL